MTNQFKCHYYWFSTSTLTHRFINLNLWRFVKLITSLWMKTLSIIICRTDLYWLCRGWNDELSYFWRHFISFHLCTHSDTLEFLMNFSLEYDKKTHHWYDVWQIALRETTELVTRTKQKTFTNKRVKKRLKWNKIFKFGLIYDIYCWKTS